MHIRGTAIHGVAKKLAKILKPLMGNATHHVDNNKNFEDKAREIKLKKGNALVHMMSQHSSHHFQWNNP